MGFRFALIAVVFFQFVRAQDPPQYGAPFGGVPDPRDVSIYQVNIRAFSAGGNLAGVAARLDQIKALGVNVVYLMPVTPVGILKTANSPYCVRDYKAVNPDFGTLEDLRSLIAGAHQRGLAVILDWVANHTAWDHPWITAHPDWYQKDGGGNIVAAKVGGFTWADVAQLDFSNHDMRLSMIDAMRYWIFAANADGFRCDYVDGPPVDFWQQANGNLRGITSHKLILYAEGGRTDNYKYFDYNHGFSFYDGLKQMFGPQQLTALKVEGENDYWYQGAGESNRIVRYITNHDVNGWDGPPQNILGGQAGAMAAFVLAAYNKGVPLIYNGQEIALDYALTFPFTGQKVAWNPNPAVTDEYARLFAFRNASEAIRRGTITSYSTADISAFLKKSNQEKVLVLVNIRNRALAFNLPADIANTTWYNGFDKTAIKFGASVSLSPYQYLVASAAPISPVALPAPPSPASGRRNLGVTYRFENEVLSLENVPVGCAVTLRDLKGKVWAYAPSTSISSAGPAADAMRIDLRAFPAGLYACAVQSPDGSVFRMKLLR